MKSKSPACPKTQLIYVLTQSDAERIEGLVQEVQYLLGKLLLSRIVKIPAEEVVHPLNQVEMDF